MTTPPGAGPQNLPWTELGQGADALAAFGVRWEVCTTLPYGEARELRNPYNDNQPIYGGGNGQEIHPVPGARLLALMHEHGHPPPAAQHLPALLAARLGGQLQVPPAAAPSAGQLPLSPAPLSPPGVAVLAAGSHQHTAQYLLHQHLPQLQHQHQHQHQHVVVPQLQEAASAPWRPVSYFLLKAASLRDLELARQWGAWPAPAHRSELLDAAFERGDEVLFVVTGNKAGEAWSLETEAQAGAPGIPGGDRPLRRLA
jgi:hypothetical protein